MIKNRPAIECINLRKAFGKKTVLRDINLKVEKGSILGLVGPNGTGKTTLLKILATLTTPSDGSAFFFGHDITADPIIIKRMTGFVPSEERSFYWRLTGKQNLEFFAALHGITRKQRNLRINDLLEAVGLGKSSRVRFREYSTGMKQSLGIARGMLHDPSVLLLDEPTRSLSPNIAKMVRKLIKNKAVNEGRTVLIASHNLKEVEELADNIAIIDNGDIVASGTLDHLKNSVGLSGIADLDKIFEVLVDSQ
ncbi:MAG: ABC transporter ATP-binding protein [Desulfobacterales bacterium]|nr:ABC transporter ATP-binding protein [Desulfobacterales bacterium]